MPKGVSSYRDRHGKIRYRYRSKGKDYAFKHPFGTPEFEIEYRACHTGVKPDIGAQRTRPGSMKALAALYFRSSWYLDNAESTRANYSQIINRFLDTRAKKGAKKYGELLVCGLERRHLQDILARRAHTPNAANNLLKKIRILMSYAVELGMRDDNPATGIRLYRTKSTGHHAWTDAEIALYEETHPVGSKARVALDLLLHTAQRRSDVVKMGRQHLKGNMISVRQQKTGERLWIAIDQEIVSRLPKDNMTFLITEFGHPFSAKAFGARFKKWCIEAGLPHCSAHGLRKAAARRLAEAGCTTHQIASVTGHRTLSEVEGYTRDVNQADMSSRAQEKLSNLRTGLDKKREKPL